MLTALEAKNKAGFINGKCAGRATDSTEHRRWRQANSMVLAWIHNSISTEIRDDFLYIQNAKELWDEIAEKYGAANAPLLFQIKRKLTLTQQEELSVAQYYSKLKKLWDQLGQLRPALSCACTTRDEVNKRELEDKLMIFLMGLNDTYDGIRDQILMMDELPPLNKAYSMILRAETQRKIRVNMTPSIDNTALAAKMLGRGNFTAATGKITGRKNPPRRDRSRLRCTHCSKQGISGRNAFYYMATQNGTMNLKHASNRRQQIW